jgi:hypothetical protein
VPATGSVYSQPAPSTSAPSATNPYAPSGTTTPANSDSGEPAYRPGSMKTSGEFSPRNISSLSPPPSSGSANADVVPAGYVQTSDTRH